MKKLILILVVIILSACTNSKYGNYIKNLPENYNHILAQNAYTQLSILYQPNKTTFKLSHEFNDAFGIDLYEKLKKSGYVIYQYNNEKKSSADTEEVTGTTLAYVIDTTDKNIYRVILYVDGKQLTKCFLIKDNEVKSLGFWTKQE